MNQSSQIQFFKLGPWTFSPEDNELIHRDGHRVKLEDKISNLLKTLLERRGVIVSKEELIEAVWQGRELSDQTIPVAISKLRKALGDDINNPTMLATVPRQGYQLLSPPVSDPKPGSTKSPFLPTALVLTALLFGVIYLLWFPVTNTVDRIQYSNAEKPTVIVTINDVRTTDATEDEIPLAIAISEMSSFFLSQVPDLLVIRHWWNLDAPDPTGGIYTRHGQATPVYSLKGTLLNDDADGKVVTFMLSDPKTDELIWSGLHNINNGSAGLFQVFSSMMTSLPVNNAVLTNAPDETVGYWRARYFMQLSNPGAVRIAANELSDMMETGATSKAAESSASALAARWQNNTDIEADIDRLQKQLGETGKEVEPGPDHLSLVDRAALALYSQSDAQGALDLLNAALERAPGDHYALSLFGEAKLLLGKRSEAIEAYRLAFRLAPYARAYEARLRELETIEN